MIELQRKLIGDRVRNQAFFDALKATVVPGKSIVVDIGSGTGFLSFLASRLGAKHCYLYETDDIVEVSKALAKRNGISNLTFSRKHSTQVERPPKADIVVSETLGNFALEENILESMEDGKRFLKPGGILIPRMISQFICPVVSDRLARDIDVWTDAGFDLAFDEARIVSQNNMYVKTVLPEDLLPDGVQEWDTVDFAKKNKSVRTKTVSWKQDSPVTVHGLALWWDAELVPGVRLSTSPDGSPTHWEQIFLPLLESVRVRTGETLECTVTSDSRLEIKINLSWTVRLLDVSGMEIGKQALDMRKGYLA